MITRQEFNRMFPTEQDHLEDSLKSTRQSLLALSQVGTASQVRLMLDGGSLLGLERDGHFLPHDNDVDLVVLNPSNSQIGALIETLRSLGLIVVEDRWQGTTQALYCSFRRHGVRHINIHLFRTSRAGAADYTSKGTVNLQGRFRKRRSGNAISRINWQTRVAGRVDMSIRVRLLSGRQKFTWVVPTELVQSQIPLLGHLGNSLHSLSKPDDCSSYLSFVYGDWKTPTTHWDWYRDDGRVRRGWNYV